MVKNESKSSYGAVPSIEQAGLTPEAFFKRKRFRRGLFCTMGVLITVVFLTIIFAMLGGHIGDTKFLVFDALFSLDAMTLNSVPSGCETTVVIARHCEKEGSETRDVFGDQHCSYIGFERAAYFPNLFSDETNANKYPYPASIYALTSDRGGHQNFREIEMVKPLAQKAGVPIDSHFTDNAKLAKTILADIASGEMCGKSIIVSWKHELIGKLGKYLACHDCPIEYPNQFGLLWQLKYVYDVKGTDLYKRINEGVSTIEMDVVEATTEEGGRMLKRKHKKRRHRLPRNWSVYFTEIDQNFDPLLYSLSVGDYQGSSVAGKWASEFIGE